MQIQVTHYARMTLSLRNVFSLAATVLYSFKFAFNMKTDMKSSNENGS